MINIITRIIDVVKTDKSKFMKCSKGILAFLLAVIYPVFLNKSTEESHILLFGIAFSFNSTL